jgi:hypothetical protein
MNYALMKSTEIQALWKLVKAGEERPLSAADLRLLMRLRTALLDYQDEIKLGQPAGERRCMICNAPVSQCCS